MKGSNCFSPASRQPVMLSVVTRRGDGDLDPAA